MDRASITTWLGYQFRESQLKGQRTGFGSRHDLETVLGILAECLPELVLHIRCDLPHVFLHIVLADALLPPVCFQKVPGVHILDINSLVFLPVHSRLHPHLLKGQVFPFAHLVHRDETGTFGRFCFHRLATGRDETCEHKAHTTELAVTDYSSVFSLQYKMVLKERRDNVCQKIRRLIEMSLLDESNQVAVTHEPPPTTSCQPPPSAL